MSEPTNKKSRKAPKRARHYQLSARQLLTMMAIYEVDELTLDQTILRCREFGWDTQKQNVEQVLDAMNKRGYIERRVERRMTVAHGLRPKVILKMTPWGRENMQEYIKPYENGSLFERACKEMREEREKAPFL